MTPLKANWMALYQPVTDHMKLDMRMNLKTKKIEIKTTPQTTNPDAIQKAADFVHAFILGEAPLDARTSAPSLKHRLPRRPAAAAFLLYLKPF